MYNAYESFKKYAVESNSLENFLDEFYKDSRYKGRGKEYATELLNSYEERLQKDGYVIISKHDSVRGAVVSYYKQGD